MNKLKTGPAVEPVTVQELGSHLRLHESAVTEDTALLTRLVSAAREYVEAETRLALVSQVWELALDSLPRRNNEDDWWDGVRETAINFDDADTLELPTGPLISIDQVRYYSQDGTENTWAAESYFADTVSSPGRLCLNSGFTWPPFTRTRLGLIIEYTAGYGAAGADVPAPLRQALLIAAADWYENRESVLPGSSLSARASNSFGALVEKYRRLRL